jgi:hypothetical protein
MDISSPGTPHRAPRRVLRRAAQYINNCRLCQVENEARVGCPHNGHNVRLGMGLETAGGSGRAGAGPRRPPLTSKPSSAGRDVVEKKNAEFPTGSKKTHKRLAELPRGRKLAFEACRRGDNNVKKTSHSDSDTSQCLCLARIQELPMERSAALKSITCV